MKKKDTMPAEQEVVQNEEKPAQKKRFALTRRFLHRFNPWLFLACLLLAAVIWCAIMYIEDPNGLREPVAALLSAAYKA